MATLSTPNQAKLQDAIGLLLGGTAHETPLSEDVIQRIAPVYANLGISTVGGAYELLRDKWVVGLIQLVEAASGAALAGANRTKVASARILLNRGTAYNTPFAQDVIDRLAPAAEATGFGTLGGFYEQIKDRPVSTMLQWALFLGKK